jgi:hypothetical protein
MRRTGVLGPRRHESRRGRESVDPHRSPQARTHDTARVRSCGPRGADAWLTVARARQRNRVHAVLLAAGGSAARAPSSTRARASGQVTRHQLHASQRTTAAPPKWGAAVPQYEAGQARTRGGACASRPEGQHVSRGRAAIGPFSGRASHRWGRHGSRTPDASTIQRSCRPTGWSPPARLAAPERFGGRGNATHDFGERCPRSTGASTHP